MKDQNASTKTTAEAGSLAILQVRLVAHKGAFWKVRIAGASTSHLWVHQDDLQIVNEIPLSQMCK